MMFFPVPVKRKWNISLLCCLQLTYVDHYILLVAYVSAKPPTLAQAKVIVLMNLLMKTSGLWYAQYVETGLKVKASFVAETLMEVVFGFVTLIA